MCEVYAVAVFTHVHVNLWLVLICRVFYFVTRCTYFTDGDIYHVWRLSDSLPKHFHCISGIAQ